MNAAGLDTLGAERYLNLETYRKSGKGVRTPVWFAAAASSTNGPTLYVYTTASSGKAKRIRRTSLVRIATCDARGKLTGVWMAARAEIVEHEEFGCGMQMLNRKYWPWKQMLDLSVRLFPRHQRVMIAIRPA